MIRFPMKSYSHSHFAAVVVAVVAVAITAPAAALSEAKAGCESRCGNITIPYPFGTTSDCYLNENFLVFCNKTSDPPKATLEKSTIEVFDVSLLGEITISNAVNIECYNSSGLVVEYHRERMSYSRFRISSTKNKFTVVGWDAIGLLDGGIDKTYTTGCLCFCGNITAVINGSCSGVGCCQSSVPPKAQDYNIFFKSIYNFSFVPAGFHRCSNAFVVKDGYYSFSSTDLYNLQKPRNFPMVLDWSVGNQTCEQARGDKDYVCRGNTTCVDTENVPGYRCSCLDGYTGNPYLHDCTDIDECQNPNNCHERAICENKNGGYNCSCPIGYHGNGNNNGTGCTANEKSSTMMIVGLSISTSILALLSIGLWILWVLKRRNLLQLRQKFFNQNGGTLMLQQLSGHDATKIFTEKDLKKATKDFHESRIIGQGGTGTVYLGTLADDRVVAIKKARIGDESQVKDFVNEVALLFNVSHKNVVKLLGCCFETQVPTLIYEYVSHGSLLDQLKKLETAPFPWELRLKIATETAEALWYLHSQLSTPIIHRDIKSANILLDENYTAKVSDFGASRLVEQDNESQKDNTAVQGTIGYVDPEYIRTQNLNEKSDVYSFGVVLVELLAGISVIDFRRNNPSKTLVNHVLTSLNSDRFAEVIDPQIATEKNLPELKAVAELARSCVSDNGDERPSMKQVFSELEAVSSVEKSRIAGDGGARFNKKEHLLEGLSDAVHDRDTSGATGDDSMKAQIACDITEAR